MIKPVPYQNFAGKDPLLDRFVSYALVPTGSDPESAASPSTSRQLALAEKLRKELEAAGAADVSLSAKGVVTATIPPSPGAGNAPVMMLNAHMDTSPEASCDGIAPQIACRWNGDDILLSEDGPVVLSVKRFPELARHIGEDIVCTNGKTLLGADDKAGITAIMDAALRCLGNPEEPHAEIRLVFTPDEEIGRGTEGVDIPSLGANYGFTVDGGDVGGLESETFNAASARIVFRGISVHPGSAKHRMVNAVKLASAFVGALPSSESPEETEGHEGFFHPVAIRGGVESATVDLIIRDHDRVLFEERKRRLAEMAESFPVGTAPAPVVTIRDQYLNMKEFLKGREEILELARKACRECGIEPVENPVRGGTDGAFFSSQGLPCPNIFTGGLNYHGIYECIPVQSLHKTACVVSALLRLSASCKA